MKKFAALLLLLSAWNLWSLPLDKSTYGILKDTKVYLQEWHIWWGFPYPDRQLPLSHMESTLTSDREPWRLNWDRNGYPFPGLYDSGNPEIIRWQIRCIKAMGFESVAVMIHPEMTKGMEFLQETDNLIKKILDLAAEEKFPVFFMDEVAFRKGSPAQDPEVMAKRISRFMGKFGRHPGFYQIDGKPVYYFQTFGFSITPEQLEKMFAQVESTYGPVHWMIFGDVGRFGKVKQLQSIICGSSGERHNGTTRQWDLKKQNPENIFAIGHKFGKKIGDIHYPKFDGTAQPWRQAGVSNYGDGGLTLETTVRDSMRFHPDMLMFSSWNDWEEGANFEPGWDFDGFVGDPYQYCRVMAHLRGLEFVPPPPPPKASVHPTIWEKLGYGDGAGPVIDRIERSNNRGGSLCVSVRDTVSPVTALEVVWEGDLYWKAPQPGDKESGGKLKLTNGKMDKPERVVSPLNFSAGSGCRVGNGELEFNAAELNTFTDNFAIGIIYAFVPDTPLKRITVTLPNKTPVALREPVGAIAENNVINLASYHRDSQLPASIWNGWQAHVSFNQRPVAFAGKPLKALLPDQTLAQISLLGAPQPARFCQDAGINIDEKGLQKKYYFELPEKVLSTPGLHAVWLRGRDAAGNWGSPVLYAVPNYEMFDRNADAIQELPLQIPDAVFADNGSNNRNWHAVGSQPVKTVIESEKKLYSRLELDNGLAWAQLPPLDGSFVLRFKIKHVNWQRGFCAWLTDGAGQQGYGIIWNSASSNQFDGQGVVNILKLQLDHPLRTFDEGVKIGKGGGSGHYALDQKFAEFEFSRNGKSGEVILKVDGKIVATAKDEAFQHFERLYLRGNRSQILDDIVVIKKDK